MGPEDREVIVERIIMEVVNVEAEITEAGMGEVVEGTMGDVKKRIVSLMAATFACDKIRYHCFPLMFYNVYILLWKMF